MSASEAADAASAKAGVDTSAPSQVNGYVQQAKGAVYSAIGSVSSDPSWKTQGEEMSQEGAQELEQAQQQAKAEAAVDRVGGKIQSAYGFITGDQETAKAGNLKAENAEWKSALADGGLPQVSIERAKGKLESAVGIVTGDIDKQQAGNMRAEKAEWTGK